MARLLHPDAAHVADTLIARGHHGVIVTQSDPMRPVDRAARTLGVEVGAIIDSQVFLLDDDPILLLVSGSHAVDLDSTSTRLDGKLTDASADTIAHATGQATESIAPVGHPTNLPTYVDTALERYPELWAAGGYPNTVFRTTFAELLRITAGLAIDVE